MAVYNGITSKTCPSPTGEASLTPQDCRKGLNIRRLAIIPSDSNFPFADLASLETESDWDTAIAANGLFLTPLVEEHPQTAGAPITEESTNGFVQILDAENTTIDLEFWNLNSNEEASLKKMVNLQGVIQVFFIEFDGRSRVKDDGNSGITGFTPQTQFFSDRNLTNIRESNKNTLTLSFNEGELVGYVFGATQDWALTK